MQVRSDEVEEQQAEVAIRVEILTVMMKGDGRESMEQS